MNCREFDRLWNERLDGQGRGPTLPATARALEVHATNCPACRSLGASYQALAQAIATLSRTLPVVPEGFTDRVLAASAAGGPEVVALPSRSLRRLGLLAAAAVLIVAVGLGLRVWRPSADRPGPVIARNDPPLVDKRDLAEALTDATNATLSLAREASAPAARVGSDVLGDAGFSEPRADLTMLSLPRVPTADVFQEVGDRLNAGVGPLSGSARSAFSFLLSTPTPPRGGATTPARPPRGA